MYVSFKQAVHQLYKSCAFAGDCRERCPLSATLLLHCSEVAMTCLHTQSHSLCLHAQSGQALHLKCAGLWLWSLVQVAFSVSNLIAQAVCGLHVKPGMQLPIASDSLQDFWGRRWNQPTSNVLRAVCHKPVLAALEARGAASHRHDSNTTTSHESGMLQADHVVTRAQARALRATQTQSAAEAHHDGTQRSSSSSHMSRKRSSTPRQTLSNGNTSQAAAPQVQPSVQSRRKLWHRACAMTWSFAVSGVMHHWMFVMLTGCSIKDVRWAMALLVQPFLIALQQAMQGSKLWRTVFGRWTYLDRSRSAVVAGLLLLSTLLVLIALERARVYEHKAASIAASIAGCSRAPQCSSVWPLQQRWHPHYTIAICCRFMRTLVSLALLVEPLIPLMYKPFKDTKQAQSFMSDVMHELFGLCLHMEHAADASLMGHASHLCQRSVKLLQR